MLVVRRHSGHCLNHFPIEGGAFFQVVKQGADLFSTRSKIPLVGIGASGVVGTAVLKGVDFLRQL